MTITIAGSVQFFNRMQQLADQLKNQGNKVFLPNLSSADRSSQMSTEQKTHHMREHIGFIKQSDAVLVANYEKNGIANYIGANTFLEMGVAFALKKLIFLLNPMPQLAYTEELEGLQPITLNGNLEAVVTAYESKKAAK